jgi:inosine/xanthosine triphosphate pyrophosphatase family protein
VPEGLSLTMAELSRQEKVRISHRSRALASLAEWLR